MRTIISFIALLLFGLSANAQQVNIQADFRARYEFRNGFSTLRPDSARPASFVTQRARLNFNYENKNLKIRLSPQNVRVWGDVSNTSKSDLNNSFHEAYGELQFNKRFSTKLGRQEIDYDDSRIFGNLDWAMQARSHDAIVFKVKPDSNNSLHLGVAFNANKETNFRENYTVGQYKALQYLWYHHSFKSAGISILFLNNGIPFIAGGKEKVAYSQTLGGRFTIQKNKLSVDASAYIQTGEIGLGKVDAQNFSLNTMYKFDKSFGLGAGIEYLSGRASNDNSGKIKSFNPLYGTNHKFNGYMDYFYVGNHINNVGLTDINFTAAYSKNKFSALFKPHYFLAAASLYNQTNIKADPSLGTELDFTASYKLYEAVVVDAGYAQMLATKSMELLKGGNSSNFNNWFFVAVKINPTIFSYNSNKNK